MERNEMKRNGKDRQKCGLWCSEMRLQLSLRLGGLTVDRQVTLARQRVWTQSNVEGVWTPSNAEAEGLDSLLFMFCHPHEQLAVSVSRSYQQVCSGYPARHNVHVHQPRYNYLTDYYLWDHFIANFDPDNACSFYYLCPCSKCHMSNPAPIH